MHRTKTAFVLLFLFIGPAAAEYAVTDIVDAAKSGDYHAVHKLLEIDREAAGAATVLLDHGADANATTREGWTPLHAAAMAGHEDMILLLQKAGADAEFKDIKGTVVGDM